MSDKYRIDPDFVVPKPTPAQFFYFCTEAEYHAGDWKPVLDRWRREGVEQSRVTVVNDAHPNPPYPHGVWFEGWTDGNARMLPFGEAGYPPLTHKSEAA